MNKFSVSDTERILEISEQIKNNDNSLNDTEIGELTHELHNKIIEHLN